MDKARIAQLAGKPTGMTKGEAEARQLVASRWYARHKKPKDNPKQFAAEVEKQLQASGYYSE